MEEERRVADESDRRAAMRSNGADKVLPVDLFIPECPPHPVTILDGLLRLLGKIKQSDARSSIGEASK